MQALFKYKLIIPIVFWLVHATMFVCTGLYFLCRLQLMVVLLLFPLMIYHQMRYRPSSIPPQGLSGASREGIAPVPPKCCARQVTLPF